MYTLTEEHTRRTVQLRNDNTFSSVDNESTLRSHVRDRSQINILNNGIEIFMIRVCTIKLQLSFQRYTVSQTAFNTIFDRILRRVNVVVQKLENEIVAGICNREVLSKHLVQAIILAEFWRGIQLEKVLE